MRRPSGRRSIGHAVTLILLMGSACAPEAAPPAEEASTSGQIPPGSDIWLARVQDDGAGAISLSELRNVTRRAGYDNQPAFLQDGSGLYYTVIDDAGQADIWRFDLADGSVHPVTATAPESEYSPTPLPSGDGFSAVRVEADSTQRLWRFDTGGGTPSVLLEKVAPVGYHAWVDADMVALFVLGTPATLEVARLSTGTATRMAADIGRSLNPIPGTQDVSYVQRLPDGATEIRRLDPRTGTHTLITGGVNGGDFHAWTPSGTLLQADGSTLFSFRPGSDERWTPIAELAPEGIVVTRIAVHPTGTWIALVGEPVGEP